MTDATELAFHAALDRIEELKSTNAELEAKVARLTSRGIEDMHARIADLTALLLELSGHPGAPAWLRGRIDSFMAETPR
jgi:hypothetical protein